MSRVRTVGVVLIVASLLAAAGCSSDSKKASTTSQPAMAFSTGGTTTTSLGVCPTFTIKAMKALVGGGKYFRVLQPTAIGKKGDPVTGESCSWERRGPSTKVRGLQVQARDYGTDVSGLVSQMTQLQGKTTGATDVPGLGDAAFSTTSPTATLLEVRSTHYFLTFSSQSEGGLDPIPVASLQQLATSALAALK